MDSGKSTIFSYLSSVQRFESNTHNNPILSFILALPNKANVEFAEVREVKMKRYELQAYNQNVVVTISDKKLSNSTTTATAFYTPDVLSYSATYADHMPMPGRQGAEPNVNYRYGAANGQEKVDEITPGGTHYTAEYWEFDARIVRRWNIDPVVKPHESPYACFANNPVWFMDVNGDDIVIIYRNEKDERVSWRFDGKSFKGMPNNRYVAQVVEAYYISSLYQRVTKVSFPFVDVVERSELTYVEADLSSRYDGPNSRIIWNPFQAFITDKGYVLSPLTALQHESGHRLYDLFDIVQDPTDTRNYGESTEEYNVMVNYETPVAQAMGEVPKGELSRKAYHGVSVFAKGPFGNRINIERTLFKVNNDFNEYGIKATLDNRTIQALTKLGYMFKINSETNEVELDEKSKKK